MALDAQETVIGLTGHIYFADVGTAAPASTDDDVDTDDWFDVGYVDLDGATQSFGRESSPLEAWQSFDPLRTIITKVPKSIKFNLLQWNKENYKLAQGGGEWTTPTPGHYVFTPPDASVNDEHALIFEVEDGDNLYRWVYPRTQNVGKVETAFTRSKGSILPIELNVLQPDDEDPPFTFQTNDPVFAAGS